MTELTSRESDPNVSTEFPVVILGEGEDGEQSIPRRRLLQGRVSERAVLYPIYALVLGAGGLALYFAAQSLEWAFLPTFLGWAMLFVWYWFYGVAYRYRRTVFRYCSVIVIALVSAGLAMMCVDRAASQVAVTTSGELVERAAQPVLLGVAVLTLAPAALLVLHLVFLGRGYREKRTS